MSTLISSVEHALAVAASDTMKVAKFVETSVLPVLKKVHADQSTIEAVTGIVSPQAANIERLGFAVLGVVIKALGDAGTAAGASGLNVSLELQSRPYGYGTDCLPWDGRSGALVITQPKPFAYQIVAGEKRAVDVTYGIDGSNHIQFRTGAYDHSRPLVIDPEIVFDKTFGGGGNTLHARIGAKFGP